MQYPTPRQLRPGLVIASPFSGSKKERSFQGSHRTRYLTTGQPGTSAHEVKALDCRLYAVSATLPRLRPQIQALIESIGPLDGMESAHKVLALEWIASGAGLFRIHKPDIPSPHLVSYFVVVDLGANQLLLVDHRNAGLWLPTGGHVEPGEHPRKTVEREVREELGIEAQFLFEDPLFVTVAETVGLTAGHTDVTLWYALQGDISAQLAFDREEFLGVRWFGAEEIPHKRSDPNLRRFLRKLYRLLGRELD